MITFEFDEAKSQANLHGINFIDAQALWDDSRLVEIPAETEDEPRYLMIGLINGKHWSAVIICRGLNVRLISVRRSRNVPRRQHFMKAKDFEQQFDDDVDITASLDLSKATCVMQAQKR